MEQRPWFVRHPGFTVALILIAYVVMLGVARSGNHDGHISPVNSADYNAALAGCKDELVTSFFAEHPAAYEDASIVDAHSDEIVADLNRCLVDRLGVDAKYLPPGTPISP